MPPQRSSITIGITGGSGAIYAVRLLPILARHYQRVDVVISGSGRQVLQTEVGLAPPEQGPWWLDGMAESQPGLTVWRHHDYSAPFASGSNCAQQMVIVPCSMSTVASIAHGIDQNLLHHAAAVTLKERRQLIVVPRETPLSSIHLRNLLTLAETGVAVIPAMPGFYGGQSTFEDLVDFVLQKVVTQLDIPERLTRKWGDSQSA